MSRFWYPSDSPGYMSETRFRISNFTHSFILSEILKFSPSFVKYFFVYKSGISLKDHGVYSPLRALVITLGFISVAIISKSFFLSWGKCSLIIIAIVYGSSPELQPALQILILSSLLFFINSLALFSQFDLRSFSNVYTFSPKYFSQNLKIGCREAHIGC